jgi:hypothetical protein
MRDGPALGPFQTPEFGTEETIDGGLHTRGMSGEDVDIAPESGFPVKVRAARKSASRYGNAPYGLGEP